MRRSGNGLLGKDELSRTVAELCGWEWHHFDGSSYCWISPNGVQMWSEGHPDYANDLNACREFELAMDESEREGYADILDGILGVEWEQDCGPSSIEPYIMASAEDRCRAFITLKRANGRS